MPKISLAAYTVRVRKRQTKDYLNTESFNGSDNISKFIQNCIGNWKTYVQDQEKQQLISLNQANVHGDVYSGILETGEYGFESRLYDVGEGKVTHTRKTSEAEMLPFYFLFGFPKKSTKGFLLLERFGAIGIRKMLTDFIQVEFSKRFPNFTLEIIPVIMEEVAAEYLNKGRIVRLSFISYSVPDDLAQYVAEGITENTGYSELVIHAKKKGSIPLIDNVKSKLAKGGDIKKIFEIPSFEYDSIKIKVEMDGNTRTIALEDLGNIRSYFTIDDEVEKSTTGHPVFESMEKIALGIYKEISGRVV